MKKEHDETYHMDLDQFVKLSESISSFPDPRYTPLWREIIDIPDPGDTIPFPKQNYNRYNLFVFRTRMRVLVYRKWGIGISLSLTSHPYKFPNDTKSKMYIRVDPMIGSKPLSLDYNKREQLRDMIIFATKDPLDTAVVVSYRYITDSKNGKTTTVPGYWIRQILPHIPFPPDSVQKKIITKYKVGFYGLEADVSGYSSAFGDLETNDYTVLYRESQIEVTRKIIDWYRKGYVVYHASSSISPSSPDVQNKTNIKIMTDWSFIKVKEHLYRPNWSDERITNPWGGLRNFINSRFSLSRDLKLYVGDNLVDYYRISKSIRNVYFANSYLIVPVENLSQAQKIANQIDNLSLVHSKVCLFKVDPQYKKIFEKVAQIMKIKDYTFYHKMDILGYSMYFSCEISFSIDEQVLNHEIKSKALEIALKKNKKDK